MSILKFAAAFMDETNSCFRKPFQGKDIQAYFDTGNPVELISGRIGTITKLNPQRALVDCGSAGVWQAPYLSMALRCPAAAAERLPRAERLREVADEARSLMDGCGLADWDLGFSTANRALGACVYRKQLIQLSLRHAFGGRKEDVRDTILHEIAHALAGPKAGHGPEWKRIAEGLGALPERCAPASESSQLAGAAAKAELQAGDWVSFLARGSRRVGRIAQKNPKTATVDVLNEGRAESRWRVSYSCLTKTDDPRPPVPVPSAPAADLRRNVVANVRLGDIVSFAARGKRRQGKVSRLFPTKAEVVCSNRTVWRVPYHRFR